MEKQTVIGIIDKYLEDDLLDFYNPVNTMLRLKNDIEQNATPVILNNMVMPEACGNWIKIKTYGQPKVDGWYLVWDGVTYDRMLYKYKKWNTQPLSETIGHMCRCKTREDVTLFVTHYCKVKKPASG